MTAESMDGRMVDPIAAISDALEMANGRRRRRLVTPDQIPQVLREALRDGVGGTTGGGVASCYGYAASTTRLWAIAIAGDNIAVRAECVSVRKNLASVPGGSRGVRTLRAKVEANRDKYIIISRDQAQRIVRLASKSEWGGCPVPPTTRVTVADSLACGNCAAETQRIRDAIGADAITAAELWQWLIAHEPATLRTFAVRALRHALNRQIN